MRRTDRPCRPLVSTISCVKVASGAPCISTRPHIHRVCFVRETWPACACECAELRRPRRGSSRQGEQSTDSRLSHTCSNGVSAFLVPGNHTLSPANTTATASPGWSALQPQSARIPDGVDRAQPLTKPRSVRPARGRRLIDDQHPSPGRAAGDDMSLPAELIYSLPFDCPFEFTEFPSYPIAPVVPAEVTLRGAYLDALYNPSVSCTFACGPHSRSCNEV